MVFALLIWLMAVIGGLAFSIHAKQTRFTRRRTRLRLI